MDGIIQKQGIRANSSISLGEALSITGMVWSLGAGMTPADLRVLSSLPRPYFGIAPVTGTGLITADLDSVYHETASRSCLPILHAQIMLLTMP